MGFMFNVFTGTLDEVRIPLIDNTNPPTMTSNGDVQTAFTSGQGRIYFEANGTRYYIVGTAPPPAQINILQGQPIPIGMGLYMTYAGNVN